MRKYYVIRSKGILAAKRPMCCFDGPKTEASDRLDLVAANRNLWLERGTFPLVYHWHEVGDRVDNYPWAIVYDEEPESNEWGEVSP